MTSEQIAYRDYLRSERWAIIARQRLALDDDECVLCGSPATQVHHRRYPRVWGEETVVDLISLCRRCHARHHGIDIPEYALPPPVPLTDEMLAIRRRMREAHAEGDEEHELELFDTFVRMRRYQLAGA